MTIAHRDTQTANTTLASTVVINKPTGTMAGDVMIAVIGFGTINGAPTANATCTAPAGWTQVGSAVFTTTFFGALFCFVKVAGGSEGSTYTFTPSQTGASPATWNYCASISGYTGVDNTTPTNVSNGVNTETAASSYNNASVTTTTGNAMLLMAWLDRRAGGANPTYTAPASTTQRANVANGTTRNFLVVEELQLLAGANATRSASTATQPNWNLSFTVALNEAVPLGFNFASAAALPPPRPLPDGSWVASPVFPPIAVASAPFIPVQFPDPILARQLTDPSLVIRPELPIVPAVVPFFSSDSPRRLTPPSTADGSIVASPPPPISAPSYTFFSDRAPLKLPPPLPPDSSLSAGPVAPVAATTVYPLAAVMPTQRPLQRPELTPSRAAGPVAPPSNVGVWISVLPAGISMDPNVGGTAANFGMQDVMVDPANPSTFFAFTCFQGMWKSTDWGVTWTHYSSDGKLETGRNWGEGIDPNPWRNPATAPRLYACTGFVATEGALYSTDGGATWTRNTNVAGGGVNNNDAYMYDVDPNDPLHVIMGNHSINHIFESTDGGATWTDKGPVDDGNGNASNHSIYVFFCGYDSNTWIAMSDAALSGGVGGVYKTTDGGNIWVLVLSSGGHDHGVEQILVVGNTGVIYMPTGAQQGAASGIWKSSDYGATWVQISTTGSTCIVASDKYLYSMTGFPTQSGGPRRPQRALRATDTTWITNDAWATIPPGMNNGPKRFAITYDGRNWIIVAGCHNAGLWRWVEPADPVSVPASMRQAMFPTALPRRQPADLTAIASPVIVPGIIPVLPASAPTTVGRQPEARPQAAAGPVLPPAAAAPTIGTSTAPEPPGRPLAPAQGTPSQTPVVPNLPMISTGTVPAEPPAQRLQLPQAPAAPAPVLIPVVTVPAPSGSSAPESFTRLERTDRSAAAGAPAQPLAVIPTAAPEMGTGAGHRLPTRTDPAVAPPLALPAPVVPIPIPQAYAPEIAFARHWYDGAISAVLGIFARVFPVTSLTFTGVRDELSFRGRQGVPASFAFKIPCGATRILNWIYTEADRKTPIDLTGLVITFTIRLLTSQITGSIVIVDAAAGTGTFLLRAGDTSTVAPGTYEADVKIIFPNGDDDFPSIGTVTLTDHASR